jgi:hypothetical protein
MPASKEDIRKAILRRRIQLRRQQLQTTQSPTPVRQGTSPAPSVQGVAPPPAGPSRLDGIRNLVQLSPTEQQQLLPQGGFNADTASATGGEIVGRIAGGAVAGPVGAAVGGGLVAAGSLGISRLARGEDVSTGELATEFGLSLLPDVALRAGRGVLEGAQRLLSRTRPGIEESTRLGADRLKEIGDNLFKPPEQKAIDQAFEAVRQSGTRLDPQAFAGSVKGLTDDSFKQIRAALGRIDAPPGKQAGPLREGAQQLLDKLRQTEDVTNIDLGTIQHIRSQIQKRAYSRPAQAGDLFDFVDIIDEFVGNARVVGGSQQGVQILQQARDLSARQKFHAEFSAFVEHRVARTQSSGRSRSLNLGEIERLLTRPQGKAAERASRALDFISKRGGNGKQEILDFFEGMKKVNIEKSLLSRDGGLTAVATDLVALLAGARPATRARFNRVVRGNKNILSPQIAILFVNAIRREQQSGSGIPGVFP